MKPSQPAVDRPTAAPTAGVASEPAPRRRPAFGATPKIRRPVFGEGFPADTAPVPLRYLDDLAGIEREPAAPRDAQPVVIVPPDDAAGHRGAPAAGKLAGVEIADGLPSVRAGRTDKAGFDSVRPAPSEGVGVDERPDADNAVYPSRVVPAVIAVADGAPQPTAATAARPQQDGGTSRPLPSALPASRAAGDDAGSPVSVPSPAAPAAATVAGTHEAAAHHIPPTIGQSASGRGVQVPAATPAGTVPTAVPATRSAVAPSRRRLLGRLRKPDPQRLTLESWLARFNAIELDPANVIEERSRIRLHVGAVPILRGPSLSRRAVERTRVERRVGDRRVG